MVFTITSCLGGHGTSAMLGGSCEDGCSSSVGMDMSLWRASTTLVSIAAV